jgi:hypothetical protein
VLLSTRVTDKILPELDSLFSYEKIRPLNEKEPKETEACEPIVGVENDPLLDTTLYVSFDASVELDLAKSKEYTNPPKDGALIAGTFIIAIY